MREILVFGEKTFKIEIPDESKVTFGPWSPQTGEKYNTSERALSGTLRIYAGGTAASSILAVFSGVKGFRDLSINYAEEVAREEGSIIWKSDRDGYQREEKVQRSADWMAIPALPKGETVVEKEV